MMEDMLAGLLRRIVEDADNNLGREGYVVSRELIEEARELFAPSKETPIKFSHGIELRLEAKDARDGKARLFRVWREAGSGHYYVILNTEHDGEMRTTTRMRLSFEGLQMLLGLLGEARFNMDAYPIKEKSDGN